MILTNYELNLVKMALDKAVPNYSNSDIYADPKKFIQLLDLKHKLSKIKFN